MITKGINILHSVVFLLVFNMKGVVCKIYSQENRLDQPRLVDDNVY